MICVIWWLLKSAALAKLQASYCQYSIVLDLMSKKQCRKPIVSRKFKKTTTATGTGTYSLNKRTNEENNGCARSFVSLCTFFLPSSANNQFCVVWRTWTTPANFLIFYFKFIAVSQIQFRELRVSWDSLERYKFTFNRLCLRRRRSSFLNSLIIVLL